MSDPVPAILDRIDADQSQALDRLMELLRIPSISTDPAHADDCEMAADWLVSELTTLGFEASKRQTPGHPMVVAHGGVGARHVLFYGHYDVQPIDPRELWDRDPFDPAIEETPHGKVIRARGASDDKGQLMTFLEACRAWKAETGGLPCRITILFEGEEESGSPSLVPFLEQNAEELRAEIALICDTGLYGDGVPAIVTSLRGLVGEELTITGPDRDLHSGGYGGRYCTLRSGNSLETRGVSSCWGASSTSCPFWYSMALQHNHGEERMDRRKDTALEAVLEQLIEHGPGEIASVFARAFELAMQIERERFLGASHYERTPERHG
ncbi:M20/M25/M40 family metallo-hydrolase, partial [Jannaschia seosinensis]|uniref:M20/M25/M40 family metallo-hydrolase n=1 Tax=Jannaschia seosinensis TaxID=313367 RepID=UPI000B013B08